MVGYQQAFTDPSFRGQILNLTYPLIGNYGTNEEDYESSCCQIAGLVVKEMCPVPSNFRRQETLCDFLIRHGVVGIAGVDTAGAHAQAAQRGRDDGRDLDRGDAGRGAPAHQG